MVVVPIPSIHPLHRTVSAKPSITITAYLLPPLGGSSGGRKNGGEVGEVGLGDGEGLGVGEGDCVELVVGVGADEELVEATAWLLEAAYAYPTAIKTIIIKATIAGAKPFLTLTTFNT